MVERFRPPHCKNCGGILKPNIVFFGDNVPRKIVEDVNSELRASDALLVLGSSLQARDSFAGRSVHSRRSWRLTRNSLSFPFYLKVFSGYRFALQAKELGIPIAIINIGPTRADHLADFKISRRCGPFLEKLISLL